MLMNAPPRYVSTGFETFVTSQGAVPVHQGLVEMTNNDLNAWSVYRPNLQPEKKWDHIDDFLSNENYPALCGGNYQNAALPQTHAANPPKVSHNSILPSQYLPSKRPSVSMSVLPQRTSYGGLSPMLGHDYAQWSIRNGRGSFAEFSNNYRPPNRDITYQPLSEPSPTPAVMSAMPSHSSHVEPGARGEYLNDGLITPNAAYSNYSNAKMNVSGGALSELPDVGEDQRTSCWPSWMRNNLGQSYNPYEDPTALLLSDGLPRYQPSPEQQFRNPWVAEMDVSNACASEHLIPSTVVPKSLSLTESIASLSSSENSDDSHEMSDNITIATQADDESEFSRSESLSVAPSSPVVPPRQRRLLPDAPMNFRIQVPVLPSTGDATKEAPRKRPMTTRSTTHPREKIVKDTTPKDVPVQEYRVAKPIEPAPEVSSMSPAQAVAAGNATHNRTAMDDFLVKSKLAGMSYKAIREQGKFTEAESTLRGRFRTLTKQKSARVRKPEWSVNDIKLLKRAVKKLADTPTRAHPRAHVPWKQVADYIANNGGLYHFGNATCRKRWDELQGDS